MSKDEAWLAALGADEIGELIRRKDWSTTPLGPIEKWPSALRIYVATMLRSRQPMFLFWGPELTQFYNAAYRPSFGEGKHPLAMGQKGRQCWGEIWEIIGPQIEGVMSSGTPTWHDNALVPIHRNGRIEEVFWTYGYSAAFDDDGAIAGVLVVCTETTQGVLAHRRLALTAGLAEAAGLADRADEVLDVAFDCFESAPSDLPFVVALGRDGAVRRSLRVDPEDLEDIPRDAASPSTTVQLRLEHPIAAGLWPEPVTEVLLVRRANGSRLVFGLSPRLPFDPSYEEFLRQLVGSVEQAKARVRAIEHRLSVEREHRDLLNQAPVAAAILVGPELRFELANSAYVEMVGREVLGKSYVEAFPEIVGTPVMDVVRAVYEEGVPFATDEMHLQLDRAGTGRLEDVYYRFNLQPLRNALGEVYGMSAIAVEITESVTARKVQQEAHEELLRAHDERSELIAQLEQANRSKDEFLAMLGHELRNPLAPIVTALELTEVNHVSELPPEHQLIKRQVRHLTRLVDDLLDVSRIARGKVELKRSEAEITQIVRRSVEMVMPLIEEREHRLTLDLPEAIPWFGDATRLAQVVANLLSNAARYTDPGGHIEVRSRVEDEQIVLVVTDDGHGIEASSLGEIFDLFFQGKRGPDRAEGGLGLGLTLARNLVERHKGTIAVESEGLGRGSAFTVRLPRRSARPSEPDRSPPLEWRAQRLLVVDDNDDAATLLSALLRKVGHCVFIAEDGPSALEAFEAERPRVVVLDIGLPGMSGYEVARRIRQLEGGAGCWLIALTGYGQAADRERAHEAGFDAHLVKPVSLEALEEQIQAGASKLAAAALEG